jgi:hypothetical protein
MLKKLLPFIVLLSVINTYAQTTYKKGYLVNLENDTIIRLRLNYRTTKILQQSHLQIIKKKKKRQLIRPMKLRLTVMVIRIKETFILNPAKRLWSKKTL